MTDEEWKSAVLKELYGLAQELKGFNGNPGLCKRVSNLEKAVRRIVYSACLVGGGGGMAAVIDKFLGG